MPGIVYGMKALNELKIIAVDPGPLRSGMVVYVSGGPRLAKTLANEEAWAVVHNYMQQDLADILLIEWVKNYGRIVGDPTFRTCQFTGELKALTRVFSKGYAELTRPEVCHILTGSRNNDKTVVKRATIDLFLQTGGGSTPEIGTRKQPGPLYLMKGSGHAWDALSLVKAWEIQTMGQQTHNRSSEGSRERRES